MSHDRVLVLTTGEKDWWWSMAEVLPTVERVWTAIGRSDRAEVRMLRVPLVPDVVEEVLVFAPTRIVLTVVTPGTIEVATLLRQRMAGRPPMILYMYGDATEGLHAFGGFADILTERDMFVCSSEADAAATRRCFPRADVVAIPFPLVDQFVLNRGPQGPVPVRLAYVGRVSEQKNLHTLLLALWIVRAVHGETPGLDVYGAVDGLGSPNMGLTFPDYGEYLRRLTKRLGLEDTVTWHGFMPRDWLFDHVHTAPHAMVSPSLHSDENFGSSVLASLVNGQQVVTTEWGGHVAYRQWFPEQLTLVPVHRTTTGPAIDPVALADAIRLALGRASTVSVSDADLDRARTAFSERIVVGRTLALLDRPGGDAVPMAKSPEQRHLDRQRARFGGGRKIFEDYADPVARLFFEAYGMRAALTFDAGESYVLPPWVELVDGVLRVDDPHRGSMSYPVETEAGEPLILTACPSMDTLRLPLPLVEALVTSGYAFVLPRATGPATRDVEADGQRVGMARPDPGRRATDPQRGDRSVRA